ncbi:MAG: hypothetical protein JKY46_00105 [Robiginitomaculum sp.]|nr:hypothetical protein [Robiginitomaculum sp.]
MDNKDKIYSKYRLVRCFEYIIVVLAVFLFLPVTAFADTVLMGEARKVLSAYGGQLWPGFFGKDFPIVIVDHKHDKFYCARKLPVGFTLFSIDADTNCRIDIREAGQFSTNIQATLPFAGAGPVAVIGAYGIIESNSTSWIATLLHENFHQYQMNWSGYYSGLTALDLAGDDDSGMWALNYPFAYDDQQVVAIIRSNSLDLVAILTEPDKNIRKKLALQYAAKRAGRLSTLTAADRRYMEFQLWQEGMARYTELALAEFAASGTHTSLGVDHDFAALAANLRTRILQTLIEGKISQHQRVYFYSLGAAEALVLDEIDQSWRESYFSNGLSMAGFFSDAINN